jgi:quinol monooxygenase YgiN
MLRHCPPGGNPMSFVLQVDVRIRPENVEAFMRKLAENAAAARGEPGCEQFEVLVDPKDSTSVMLFEIYADEKAFEQHQQTPAFRKYAAEAVPLLASRDRHVWKRAAY